MWGLWALPPSRGICSLGCSVSPLPCSLGPLPPPPSGSVALPSCHSTQHLGSLLPDCLSPSLPRGSPQAARWWGWWGGCTVSAWGGTDCLESMEAASGLSEPGRMHVNKARPRAAHSSSAHSADRAARAPRAAGPACDWQGHRDQKHRFRVLALMLPDLTQSCPTDVCEGHLLELCEGPGRPLSAGRPRV